MTDTGTPVSPNPAPAHRCTRRRGLPLLAVALIGLGVGVFATKAISHGVPWGHHYGPGFMHTGGLMAPATPAEAEDRAQRMAKHFALEIDATKEQTEKLVTIAKAAARDVLPMREKFQAARTQGLEAFAAPALDRATIEKVRSEQIANMDALSKRLSAALEDAAEVMTPEQRQKLAERIKTFRERHGWGFWRRG